MTKNDKFGEAYFTQMVRSLAVQCKFKDAEKYTMRSTRRTMLTKMVKGGVDNATLIKSGRHKDASTNALYIEENEEAHVRRGEALQYNPKASSKKKKKKKRKSDRSSSSSSSTAVPAFASMPQFPPVAMPPHIQQAMQQAMAQAAQATMAQFMPNMSIYGNPGMGMFGGNYLQGIMAQGPSAGVPMAASKHSKSRDDSSDDDSDSNSESSDDDDSIESSSDEDSASDEEATSSDEEGSDDED